MFILFRKIFSNCFILIVLLFKFSGQKLFIVLYRFWIDTKNFSLF